MMHHLDTDDVRLLDEILSRTLHGLVVEIAHADDRAFRDALRARYEQIEVLRLRICEVSTAPSPDVH